MYLTDDKFVKIIWVPEGPTGSSIINLHLFSFVVIFYSHYPVVPIASPTNVAPKVMRALCGYMFCHWFINRPKVFFPVLGVLQILTLTLSLMDKEVLFKEISLVTLPFFPIFPFQGLPYNPPPGLLLPPDISQLPNLWFSYFYSRKTSTDFSKKSKKYEPKKIKITLYTRRQKDKNATDKIKHLCSGSISNAHLN